MRRTLAMALVVLALAATGTARAQESDPANPGTATGDLSTTAVTNTQNSTTDPAAEPPSTSSDPYSQLPATASPLALLAVIGFGSIAVGMRMMLRRE